MIGLVNISFMDADHKENLVEFDWADAVVQPLVKCDQREGKLMEFVVAIRNYVVELVSLL